MAKRKISLLFFYISAFFALGTGALMGWQNDFWRAQPVQAIAITSVKSGNWLDSAVWNGGVVPRAGDSVTIAAGHTVIYNALSDAVLGRVDINGILYFSRTQNTRLKTNDSVVVNSGGYLNMGTDEDPIPKSTRAEMIWQLTQAQADAFVPVVAHRVHSESPGLYALGGSRWEVYGAALTRTWSRLALNSLAGTATVVTENDVSDWPVGGTIVLSSTRNPSQYSIRSDGREIRSNSVEHELATIQSVDQLAGGKARITLAAPLKFTHTGTDPYKGEVALITRNILFKTELLGTSETVQQNDVRERKYAHSMYMPNSTGNLQYAEFKYMGHYGNLGTYATHHHQMQGTSRGMTIRGISGWYNGFRCVNLHLSHQVLVEDNVCFSSSSTSYFVELDPFNGDNADHAFVRNIGIGMKPKHFDDRNDSSIAGEPPGRTAVDFWPSTTNHEAFLGNVAAGDGGEESQGYHMMEIGSTQPGPNRLGDTGVVPWTFVANEVHSKVGYGMYTWQNPVPGREIIDFKAWKNGTGGVLWGAYSHANRYFNAQLLENGTEGVRVTSTNTFLQDSVVTGSTSDNSSTDNSWFIDAYTGAQLPTTPLWLVRNTFKDWKTAGISQLHDLCRDSSVEKRPIMAEAACSATYITQMGNTFENVPKKIDFGWQANANAFWKVLDYNGTYTDADGNAQTIKDFVLLRKDQLDPAKQGPISAKLVTSSTFYSPTFDALVTPLSSLPSSIEYVGLEPNRPDVEQPLDFTFRTARNYPPKVSLNVAMAGTTATMTATATDDTRVDRVEFFVDWIKVGTVTNPGPTSQVTVDLANLPSDGTSIPKRKYAYLYARAFDGTEEIEGYEQRAYSNTFEIGPEVLLQGQSGETPTSITPVPTSDPLPTSFDQLHLYLDRIKTVTLTGSNLTGDFKVEFLKDGVPDPRLTFSFITGGTTSLTLDFTTKDLSSAPLGEYTVRVTRTLDGQAVDHPKTFVFTRLGDLWRPGATDSTEQKRDGRVDIADVSRMLLIFGKSSGQSGFDQEADLNGPARAPDGMVDLYDANKLMANWTN